MKNIDDFEAVADQYDDGRKPTGIDVILGMIQGRTQKPLQEIRLLDVGGGTGTYSVAALEHGVGHVTLYDGSKGMVACARRKMAGYGVGRVNYFEDYGPPLKLEDNSFDAVMINQVLHHVDHEPTDPPFAKARTLVSEVKRVLKPGGCIIITEATAEQRKAYWFFCLYPKALERITIRVIPRDLITSWLTDEGFASITALNYMNTDMFHDYDNERGPLEEEWRARNPFFRVICTEHELAEGLLWAEDLLKKDKLKEFKEEHDQIGRLGAFYFLVATKI